MTEITIKISSLEARQILNGLSQMSFDYWKRAEQEELQVIEYQLDGNEVGEKLAQSRAERARLHEMAANTAYNKIKTEAIRLGLIG